MCVDRADLDKVRCPALILQHRSDALAPLAVGQYLHTHLAGSTLNILDVSGHCAHMSNPALVAHADSTMYAVKHAGKNGWCVYSTVSMP